MVTLTVKISEVLKRGLDLLLAVFRIRIILIRIRIRGSASGMMDPDQRFLKRIRIRNRKTDN